MESESVVKRLLFVVAAVATLGLAAPAGAQVFMGADSGGVGVQLGPLGVGVGPRFSDDRYYRHQGYYDGRAGYDANASYYGGDCRLVRSRYVTPRGRVVFRTRRICG
jgi:hypothetical protein